MPDTYSLENDAPARRVFTIAGLLLVLIPLVQSSSQLWPMQLSNIQWRMGAASVLSGLGLLPFLGFALIGAGARFGGQRLVERVIGWMALILSILMFAALGLFVLDALQMKSIVTSRAMDGFKQNSVRVVVQVLLLLAAFTSLALAMLRGSPTRSVGAKTTGKVADDRIGLIVGRS